MPVDQPMDAARALALLAANWPSDPHAWKPKGCPFGPDARTWPPRILSALAQLAGVAGAAHRVYAVSLVDREVEKHWSDSSPSRCTPEHINTARMLLTDHLARQRGEAAAGSRKRLAGSYGDRQGGARKYGRAGHGNDAFLALSQELADQRVEMAVKDRAHAEAVAAKDKTLADQIAAKDEELKGCAEKMAAKDAQLEAHAKKVASLERQLVGKVADAKAMREYEVDAQITMLQVENDMLQMSCDAYEQSTRRFQKDISEKDKLIKALQEENAKMDAVLDDIFVGERLEQPRWEENLVMQR